MRTNCYSLTILLLFLYTHNLVAQASFVQSQIGPNNLLTTPWELTLAPDGYLWVTERQRGVVVRIDPETAGRDELLQIPDVYTDRGQDGLLGMAMHDRFNIDSPYVYLSYTYILDDEPKQRLVRYTYDEEDGNGTLTSPFTIIDKLPASDDHNSGRLVFGPDHKLYYSIGDQGSNQSRNYCNEVLSQVLPGQDEVDSLDWTNYPGKFLRINTDGSIPDDNPMFNGVRSHIFSYGHRNAQGIDFGSNGFLYSSEHGPNTDDEVNLIRSGGNYGWPNVVGYQDDMAYTYCNWSSAPNCLDLEFSRDVCPESAVEMEESSFDSADYREPLFSLFAVPDDYDFDNPACQSSWFCRPNIAPSSIAVYESDAIPGWANSLLVTSLKRGRVYRLQLNEDGTEVTGDTSQVFYTSNRYRDIEISPDGRTIYFITDQTGRTSDESGLNQAPNLMNPGAILTFTLSETVGTLDSRRNSPLRMWPNPSKGTLFFDIPDQVTGDVVAEIINTQGQVVRRLSQLQSGTQQFNTSDLPSGFYAVKVRSSSKTWLGKAMIN